MPPGPHHNLNNHVSTNHRQGNKGLPLDWGGKCPYFIMIIRYVHPINLRQCMRAPAHFLHFAISILLLIFIGQSGTIGYAIAQALKASFTPSLNWHIILIGRRPPPPSITDVDGKPPEVLPYDTFLKAEMTNEQSVSSALDSHFEALQNSPDENVQSLNRLDLLINCAGCSLGNEPITTG